MNEFDMQQKEFLAFLKLLADNDLLDKVMVAGSWAEYVYAQSGLLPGFDGNLKTLDVDFLIKNQRRPNPPTNIAKLASDAGYEVLYDILDETTKIITPERLEIEFLLNQMGSGTHRVLPTNLGVNAQALRHMDISLRNTVTVDMLTLSVTVPKPEAYVLHKMVINTDRKPAKQEKDARAVYRLAPYLNQEVYTEIYESFTKKEKQQVDAFLAKRGPLFESKMGLDAVLADASARSERTGTKEGKTIDELDKE